MSCKPSAYLCTIPRTVHKQLYNAGHWATFYDAASKSNLNLPGADNSLAQPGREQARKHVRDARDFNNIETRAVKFFFFMQGKAPKEIRAILTEILACFLPGRAKDLSAPLY